MAGKLGIAGTNCDYSHVALFYRNNRLYQIDGTAFVAQGQAEASNCFASQRKLMITSERGSTSCGIQVHGLPGPFRRTEREKSPAQAGPWVAALNCVAFRVRD
jgi:hypothetical protein